MPFQWADSLVLCGQKADLFKKLRYAVSRISGFVWMGLTVAIDSSNPPVYYSISWQLKPF